MKQPEKREKLLLVGLITAVLCMLLVIYFTCFPNAFKSLFRDVRGTSTNQDLIIHKDDVTKVPTEASSEPAPLESSTPTETSTPTESETTTPDIGESQKTDTNTDKNKPEPTKPKKDTSSQTKETEPKATEPKVTQPKETQPKETKPKETEPKETQPKETQPKETEPKETKPKETKPKETQPPVETEPTEYCPELPEVDPSDDSIDDYLPPLDPP